jgi:hypothetical protein
MSNESKQSTVRRAGRREFIGPTIVRRRGLPVAPRAAGSRDVER